MAPSPNDPHQPSPFSKPSRRDFLLRSGGGLGGVVLASMMDRNLFSREADKPALQKVHFKPKVKRVIHLFMHGGPSHVDLFDPKPDLKRFHGKPLPESFGKVMTRRKVAHNPLLGPIRPFKPRGQSGLEISDFLPHIAQVADELTVIRSCHGDSVNHPQSVYQMNTGSILMGKPSLGSWLSYGLGTENQNMPAYVVLPDPGGAPKGGPPAWSNGFLPSKHQGTLMRPGKDPIVNLRPSGKFSTEVQKESLKLIQTLNQPHFKKRDFDTELEARIKAYELAYRMQAAAPVVVGIENESPATLALYGVGEKDTHEFGVRCLIARRMVERGVRFVQLYSGNTNGWDAHSNVEQNHSLYSKRTDKPVAGLLKDLRQRGLLDDTLVIWGGEFGRMPMSEQGKGRDHNPWGYSIWMAGGGLQGGIAYGETDPIGLRAAKDKVHVHDLHATILHLLGIDHERLTYFHNGREDRLTDVAGEVIHKILS